MRDRDEAPRGSAEDEQEIDEIDEIDETDAIDLADERPTSAPGDARPAKSRVVTGRMLCAISTPSYCQLSG